MRCESVNESNGLINSYDDSISSAKALGVQYKYGGVGNWHLRVKLRVILGGT